MPVYEDPDAPHQIVLRFVLIERTKGIGVGCTCMPGEYLEVRPRWDSVPEQFAIWRSHLPARVASVEPTLDTPTERDDDDDGRRDQHAAAATAAEDDQGDRPRS